MYGLLLVFLIVFSSDITAADDDSSIAQDPVAARTQAIQATLSEMRAIAYERADFNGRWVKFLNEGRFSDADTEVITDPHKRLIAFAQTFCGRKELDIVLKVPQDQVAFSISIVTSSCVKDSEQMQKFGKCLEAVLNNPDQDLEMWVDKLFMFFHFAWCVREEESGRNRETSEKYWMGVLRNKLAPLAAPEMLLCKDLFKVGPVSTASRKTMMQYIFWEKMQKDYLSMQDTRKKIDALLSNLGDATSHEAPQDTSVWDKAVMLWYLKGQELNRQVAEALGKVEFNIENPLSFFRWCDQGVGILVQGTARKCQESELLKRKISDILALLKASTQTSPPTAAATSTRKPRRVKAGAQLLREDSAVQSMSDFSQLAAAAASSDADNGNRSGGNAESTSSDEASSGDILITRPLEDYLLNADEEAAAVVEEDAADVVVTTTTTTLTTTPNHSGVDYLFQAGQVNYRAFLRKLNRDFGDLVSLAIAGNSTLLTLRYNGHFACAMYDTPHGAQLRKAYPHWRIAIQKMLEKVGLGRQ